MKKSRAVRLVLLGGAGAALAACDQAPPPDAQFYTGVDECAVAQGEAVCKEAFAESKATFDAEAPQFARKEQCEAEFGVGNCENREASAGGGFFMPMMMGYMLGSAFRQPVYRGPDNNAMVRTGGSSYTVGRFNGIGKAAAFQPGQITKVQRGGFGSTASSYRSTAGG